MSVSFKFRDPLPPPPPSVTERRVNATSDAFATATLWIVWIAAWIAVSAMFTIIQVRHGGFNVPSYEGAGVLISGLLYVLIWGGIVIAHAIVAVAFLIPAVRIRPKWKAWVILGISIVPEIAIGLLTPYLGASAGLVAFPLGVGLTFVVTFVLVARAAPAITQKPRPFTPRV